MRLIKCHIDGYGTYINKDFLFDKDFNSFNQLNGTGKSTLSSFIVSMLYGLDKTTIKTFKDRDKYLPFNSHTFGGSLDFEFNLNTYHIERTFDKKSQTKDSSLIYENDKLMQLNEEIGEYLFKLDKESYKRILFVNNDSLNLLITDNIKQKLNNDFNNISENFDLTKLEKKLKASVSPSNIKEKKEDILNLKSKIKELKQEESSLDNLYKDKKELDEKISLMTLKSKEIDNNNELFNKYKKLEDFKKELDESKERLNKIKEETDNVLMTKSDIEDSSSYLDNLKRLSENENLLNISPKDKQEKEYFDSIFKDGIPDVDKLNEKVYDALLVKEENIDYDLIKKYDGKTFDFNLYDHEINSTKPKYLFIFPLLSILFLIFLIIFKGLTFKIIFAALMIMLLTIFIVLWFVPRKSYLKLMLMEYNFNSGNLKYDYLKFKEEYEKYKEEVKKKEKSNINLNIELQNDLKEVFKKYLLDYDLKTNVKHLRDNINKYKYLIDLYEKNSIKKGEIEKEKQKYNGLLKELETKYSHIIDKDYLARQTKVFQQTDIISKDIINKEKDIKKFKEINNLHDEKPSSLEFVAVTDALSTDQKDIEQRAKIENNIEHIKNDLNYALELEEDLNLEEEKLSILMHEKEINDLTIKYLNKTQDNIQERFGKPVKDSFKKYADAISYVVGQKISFDSDYNMSYELDGHMHKIEHLSSGEMTLCVLCLRLALIDQMKFDDHPLIILDDPFVNLDKTNMEKARQIVKIINKNNQLLYFTCSDERKI